MKPSKILMCKPDFFDVNYVGNEFMKDNEGNVDHSKALKQWEDLKNVYESLGFNVCLIEPVKDHTDMVFTANQSLPFIDKTGNRKVILAVPAESPALLYF